jgi:phosphoserine phosphatase
MTLSRFPDLPLCVDLDGTLVQSDTLWILCKKLFKKKPFFFLRLIGIYIAKGRAAFKSALSSVVGIDPKEFSYHPVFLEHLRKVAQEGQKLFLVTGADQAVAEAVASHLKIFQGVMASDGKKNCVGPVKAKILCHCFGLEKFSYAGNSWQDVPVWACAAEIILVNAPTKLVALMKKKKGEKISQIF